MKMTVLYRRMLCGGFLPIRLPANYIAMLEGHNIIFLFGRMRLVEKLRSLRGHKSAPCKRKTAWEAVLIEGRSVENCLTKMASCERRYQITSLRCRDGNFKNSCSTVCAIIALLIRLTSGCWR